MPRIYPNIDSETPATGGVCLTCKTNLSHSNPGFRFNVEYSYMNGEDETEVYCSQHGLEYKKRLQENRERIMERRRAHQEKEEAARMREFERLKAESDAVSEGNAAVKAKYDVKELTPYQWRINGVLDLYPVSRKWHDIKNNKRGSYRNVLEFCNWFFNSSQAAK